MEINCGKVRDFVLREIKTQEDVRPLASKGSDEKEILHFAVSPRVEFASAAGSAAVFESNPGMWVIRFPDTTPAALEAQPSPHVKISHEADTGRTFEVKSP